MSRSAIEWTDHTWNPVRGCSRISPGCMNCYAERQAARNLPGMKSPTTGEPFAVIQSAGPRWTGKVELIEHMLKIPLRTKKPTTYFVNSMSDLFHEALPDEAIDPVFLMMSHCQQHTFQVLTKRARRMWKYFAGIFAGGIRPVTACVDEVGWPLPNVWLGVSAEDQKRADERIPLLLQTPAAVRFISAEPLLEPLDLRLSDEEPDPDGCYADRRHGLHWVIVGGESGPGARPFEAAWARGVVRQCRDAQVPVFVKQLGANPRGPNGLGELKDRKGGDPAEWPADLRIREFPRGIQRPLA